MFPPKCFDYGFQIVTAVPCVLVDITDAISYHETWEDQCPLLLLAAPISGSPARHVSASPLVTG